MNKSLILLSLIVLSFSLRMKVQKFGGKEKEPEEVKPTEPRITEANKCAVFVIESQNEDKTVLVAKDKNSPLTIGTKVCLEYQGTITENLEKALVFDAGKTIYSIKNIQDPKPLTYDKEIVLTAAGGGLLHPTFFITFYNSRTSYTKQIMDNLKKEHFINYNSDEPGFNRIEIKCSL